MSPSQHTPLCLSTLPLYLPPPPLPVPSHHLPLVTSSCSHSRLSSHFTRLSVCWVNFFGNFDWISSVQFEWTALLDQAMHTNSHSHLLSLFFILSLSLPLSLSLSLSLY